MDCSQIQSGSASGTEGVPDFRVDLGLIAKDDYVSQWHCWSCPTLTTSKRAADANPSWQYEHWT